MDGDVTISKKKIMIVISIVLSVVLLVAIGYLIVQNKKLRDDKAALEAATATASITATNIPVKTATKTVSATATPTTEEALQQAKDVAIKFMTARKNRDLTEATPYMTDSLIAKTTSESFAGTSSPSIGSIEFQTISANDGGTEFTAKVKANWLLNNEPSGSSIFTLELKYKNGSILVDNYTEEQ